jgi:hypothetical protein
MNQEIQNRFDFQGLIERSSADHRVLAIKISRCWRVHQLRIAEFGVPNSDCCCEDLKVQMRFDGRELGFEGLEIGIHVADF